MNIERNEDFSEKFSFSFLNNAQENCNLDFFYTLIINRFKIKIIEEDITHIKFVMLMELALLAPSILDQRSTDVLLIRRTCFED